MKIGIVGSGNVGQALAKGLVEAGHEVMIGTRDTTKKELFAWKKKSSKKGSIGNVTQAAGFGEVVILAIAWRAGEDVLAQIRPELSGKVVIDVTNPLEYKDDGPPTLAVGHTTSGGELVQQSLPDSHVVKALNIINFRNMVFPQYKQGKPTMPICGNNPSALNTVKTLLADLGWEDIVVLGNIEKSRLLEPLCLFWVEVGVTENTWDHAISLLRK